MHIDMTLLQILAVLFLPGAWGQSGSSLGVVVEAKNITAAEGSTVSLPCQSPRMVWTRDRLKDRQRVVHWDLVRSSPEYSVERVVDMSPGAHLRVYNGFNKGRISIPDTAFTDGNFSLVIHNVVATDKGVYTCNLHHHYCKIHQSVQVQLNVTKSARREKRYWDGEKTVFVVLLGSSVVLPCVNRRSLWREGLQEDQQQVAHWDFQPPGVRPDKADRLVDLYASGERRDYGPLFGQRKMSVAEDAFTFGDFSLFIADLKPVDKGLYSCNLHHHYCGLQERRIFRLTVGPRPPTELITTPRTFLNDELEPRTAALSPNEGGPRVVNVFLPEQRNNFVQHLGYFLTTLLLLAIVVIAVVVLTRRRKKRGLEFEHGGSVRGIVSSEGEMTLDCSELKTCNQDPLNSEYKNNLLKERDMTKDCNKEFDGRMWK
ncbi:matrix-remodeling-associated protein 8 [Austrofundulus limnaeus]|uniref:Matrix remodeling-associated protein 8 n=1 Tax=Austrofundulus limnaeus TaxID=52670 RepID=A0A2I4BF74_AUSLI|nr:PREDICTED: matrix-remodeling-associated protein 8-like [Austrofundulus limnaeus]